MPVHTAGHRETISRWPRSLFTRRCPFGENFVRLQDTPPFLPDDERCGSLTTGSSGVRLPTAGRSLRARVPDRFSKPTAPTWFFGWLPAMDRRRRPESLLPLRLSDRPDRKCSVPRTSTSSLDTADRGKDQYRLPQGGLLGPHQTCYWAPPVQVRKGSGAPGVRLELTPSRPVSACYVTLSVRPGPGALGTLRWRPSGGTETGEYRIYGKRRDGASRQRLPFRSSSSVDGSSLGVSELPVVEVSTTGPS